MCLQLKKILITEVYRPTDIEYEKKLNMEEMSCGKRRCVKTSERFPQANPYTQTRVSFLKMFKKNGKCIEKYFYV